MLIRKTLTKHCLIKQSLNTANWGVVDINLFKNVEFSASLMSLSLRYNTECQVQCVTPCVWPNRTTFHLCE